jgi:hypothetical protein
MKAEISPQIRIVALVGLLLIVVAGAGSLVLGRSGSSSVADQAPSGHRTTTTAHTQTTAAKPGTHATKPAAHGTMPATKPHATAASGTKAKAKAKTGAKPAAGAKAKAKPVARGNLVDARLPAQLQWQLSQHKVVVVSLYDPRADVDAISVAEAHAGATDAGVGFLLVDVLDNTVAGPLTSLLPGGGLLPDPGVLVYRAPGTLAFRLDGFNDRDTVAQAAENAAAGQSDPTLGTPQP